MPPQSTHPAATVDALGTDGGLVAGARYRLAAVAAGYAAYLVAYFVLGQAVFDARGFYWHDALVIVLAGLAGAQAGRHCGPPLRRFLLWNAASMLWLLVTDLSYGRDLPLHRDRAGESLQLTDVAYVVFLFSWLCTWGALALALAQRQRPGWRTVLVFVLLMAGFVGLFAGFYTPLYGSRLGSLNGRLDAAMAVLELAAVVTGLAVLLLGVGQALVLQVFGMTLLVASDMLYSEASPQTGSFAAADPVWMLGLCLLLAGALVQPPGPRRRAPAGSAGALDGSSAGGPGRSGLSTLLLALSLGAVLLSAQVSLALRGAQGGDGTSAGEPFFYVLFVVALVVVMVWLTDRFDRAVALAGRHAAQLVGQHLRAGDWRRGDRTLVWLLEATGLGRLLDGLQADAARLRQDVLFLGPERLNPPPQDPRPGEPPDCFLVMPFGQPDSDTVHRVLRQACQAAGLRPVRGDDLFTPTDILDDLWRGITGAHCVIADISGRNPNVMYELGMAHTLAKPVLILARDAADIPIDLATRRVIVYGPPAAGADWPAALAARTQAALQALLQDYPPGAAGPALSPAGSARTSAR